METEFLNKFITTVQGLYQRKAVGLHEPVFSGNEKQYLSDVIDSTYVSYTGKYVDEFELKIAAFSGTNYAVSTVNGTSALHAALLVNNVKPGDDVITQALTFVATANAIKYCGANPVFLDVDKDTMSLGPSALLRFLKTHTKVLNGEVFNSITGNKISCIMPMHTFGIPAKIREISEIAANFGIPVIEDAAEALGSSSKGKSMGSFGECGIFSFNANKIITSGGGGMIVTDDEEMYRKLMHITKTSKTPHKYEFHHDEVGFNYRMPNINACVGLAQLERIHDILDKKRELAEFWAKFFEPSGFTLCKGQVGDFCNNWLMAIQMETRQQRDEFLDHTNNAGISTRPIWMLMTELSIYKDAVTDELIQSRHLADTIVNIPSGVLPFQFGLQQRKQ